MNAALHHHAVFEGRVTHRRLRPKPHAFQYPLSFVYLNLDRLPEAFAGRPGWSCTTPNVAWFRRGDHLGDPQTPLAESVRRRVREAGGDADGPVCLLTQLRYWGFVMNPVSFYYCFTPDGERLSALAAEVHNTPWGEQHCYVLPAGADEIWLDKRFHVSPFLPMELRYRFRFTPPAAVLRMKIDNFDRDERVFTARLQLTRRAWTSANLRRVLWRYPFQTQAVYAAIYWQAFRLWRKGTPYFPHPGAAAPGRN